MSTAAPLQTQAAKFQPVSISTHAGLLMQRKCACGSPTASLTGECAECKSKKLLQTKLAIGASNDPLEQEADRVADQVLAAPANPAVRGAPPRIQRFTGQANGQTDTAPASVDHVLADSGRPLGTALRQDMEERFGHDFSRVRVHSGGAAEQSARDVKAHAYTVGHNIVFGAGRFVPGTHAGRRLVAHELAHVVQQSGGQGNRLDQGDEKPGRVPSRIQVQRQPKPQEGMEAPEPRTASWQKLLDEILPPRGLLEHINRVTILLEKLGDAELTRVTELIYKNREAKDFVRRYGVPGFLALHETLTGPKPNVLPDRLDVPAAEFLLTTFTSRTSSAPDKKAPPEVFAVEDVRKAYVRFHRNALLIKEDEQGNKVRRNCILIVRDLVPQLFRANPKLAKRITTALSKLHGKKLTMPDVGKELVKLGVAGKPSDIRFKGGKNGNQGEPKELDGSAWEKIKDMVGDTQGWHIFGMSLMDGHHSVTLFVDNAPDGYRVYWADQWAIDGDEDFGQETGSISGFRRYQEAGFDEWIEQTTKKMWNNVYSKDSKCGKRNPKTWQRSCMYNATLRIWHLRTIPEPVARKSQPSTKVAKKEKSSSIRKAPVLLQRKCACGNSVSLVGECAECQKRKISPHRHATPSLHTIDDRDESQAILAAVHEALSSPGQPLEQATRGFMEPRFVHDFNRVRVHTDARAGESARAVNALGYTVGNHVVFAAGQYAPQTASGRKLLAHELTHTIQQQGVPGLWAQPALSIGSAGDVFEREADAVAEEVAAGRVATPVRHSSSGGTLRKQPAAAPRVLTRVEVNQSTQRVTITWNDGSPPESDQCSTGKGHCCFDESLAEGGVCSAAGSRMGGSNCTPVGTFRVTDKFEKAANLPELWTQFADSRSIALHEYAPVDGTPLSHGCVRLHRPMAQKIFDGSVRGRTVVQVQNLAQPRCNHAALQREWMGDFSTAGTTPPDGERIDPVTRQRRSDEEMQARARSRRSIRRERAALESALGVDEAGLDAAIGELRGPTQDYSGFAAPADFERRARREGREALTARIPRCLPTRTAEETRVPAAQQAGLAAVPAELRTLRRALERSTGMIQARRVVRRFGQVLWDEATSRAQAASGVTDDRTLYWTRLQMTEVIRQFNARWTRETPAHNPDTARRERQELLHIFEQSSRGMESASFGAGGAGMKRIVVSGFDPFSLDRDIRQGNPSGSAVLKLDGRVIPSGGVRGRVQGVIFPVRYTDFDAGISENVFRPYLTGSSPVDLILTISMGTSPDIELETIAGRRRSSFAEDNARRRGNPEEWRMTPQSRHAPPRGGQALPPEIPGVGSGPEFSRTNMLQPGTATFGGRRTTTLRPTPTLSAMHRSLGHVGGRVALAEQSVWEIRPGQREAEQSLIGPTGPGSRAFAGSGGGYLSNEIYYRTLQLRRQSGATTQAIHVHTPLLNPGAPAADRDRIVAAVEALIVAALPTL